MISLVQVRSNCYGTNLINHVMIVHIYQIRLSGPIKADLFVQVGLIYYWKYFHTSYFTIIHGVCHSRKWCLVLYSRFLRPMHQTLLNPNSATKIVLWYIRKYLFKHFIIFPFYRFTRHPTSMTNISGKSEKTWPFFKRPTISFCCLFKMMSEKAEPPNSGWIRTRNLSFASLLP